MGIGIYIVNHESSVYEENIAACFVSYWIRINIGMHSRGEEIAVHNLWSGGVQATSMGIFDFLQVQNG